MSPPPAAGAAAPTRPVPANHAPLPYAGLADLVAVLHFIWILFLFFGAIWGRRNRLVRVVHIAGLVFVFLVETLDWYCPLTDLEVWLRHLGGGSSYAGSFVAYYLNQIIYLTAPRSVIVTGTVLLCAVNAWLYLHPTHPANRS
ncbi:DUF2784 domain-containing protein [Geomesophilobacter sediminis]|uniref:DUF2784 domain-containing protein n=1 Tax=Geomesophilobacter sediminis TaxID=2798584 RepID=A0A8J7SC84_9BACT|nr:DUF2784 domain-containing protein [Geomesophilobacter sediminis]MBJ6726959.1 DUF2784 domain-containing protein [Geomesophilobacter sediminis]